MKQRLHAALLFGLVCALMAGASSLPAEELFIVDKSGEGIDAVASLDGVAVYAVLEDGLLVGADGQGSLVLSDEGSPARIVSRLGERNHDRSYYLFRIDPENVSKLPPGLEILAYSGEEAVARAAPGYVPDHEAALLTNGFTRISFRPLSVRGEGVPAEAGSRMNPVPDPIIDEIVNQVSQTEFTDYLQRLQDFVTRYSYTDSCRAAEQWAVTVFDALGLETELWPYNYSGYTWYNAVGRKIGTVHPDSIYLILGHIDSISEDPWDLAPGAEDNGSGSACVLEAARVLSQYDFDCSIEFLLVSGEELGLHGSEAYAEYCSSTGRNIAGVLNFDMISYTGSYGWDTNIYADQNFPAEVALADLLAQLTDDYSDAYSIRVDTDGPVYGSDHYYFSLYGFPAPFSIDAQLWGAPDWYPWYHTTDDVITHLNLPFGTAVVKGAVATLATVASPSVDPILVFTYPDGLPELIDPDGGTTFRVEVTAGTGDPQPDTGELSYSTGSGYTTVPLEVVSPNVYDAVFPAIECGSTVTYYLSALTTDDSLATDPRTAPEATYSALCAYDLVTVYEDDFSSNLGWTGLGGSGEWTIGPAVGGDGDDSYGGADPAEDHSPSTDDQVLGNDLTSYDGDYEANLGTTYWVTSPVVDCSNYLGVSLAFWRWLGVERDIYDEAFIQVYDGATWVTIFENGGSTIDDGAWREQTYDVSAWADGNPDFKVRFGIGPSDGAWQYCGWNVDDMTVTGYSCTPPAGISAELIPDDDPVIVPQGGRFGMTGYLTNNGTDPVTTDVWVGAYRNTHWFQQRLYEDVPMAAGQTRQAHFYQDVPGFAPPGDYAFVEFCGDYQTWTVVDSSFFIVSVVEAAGQTDSPGETSAGVPADLFSAGTTGGTGFQAP